MEFYTPQLIEIIWNSLDNIKGVVLHYPHLFSHTTIKPLTFIKIWNNVSGSNTKTRKQKLALLDFVLTRTFGTVSVGEPSQRKSSTSSSHDEGRVDGRGRGPWFWSCGTGVAVSLPDPHVLCALRVRIRVFLEFKWDAVRIQNRQSPNTTS